MTAGPMMVRINCPRAFIQKIAPWLERRNNGREQRFSLQIHGTGEILGFEFSGNGLNLSNRIFDLHRNMTRTELASIVFGAHPDRRMDVTGLAIALKDVFPFYFPIWMLDHS